MKITQMGEDEKYLPFTFVQEKNVNNHQLIIRYYPYYLYG